MTTKSYEFFATTAKGIEPILKRELLDLGVNRPTEEIAGVQFVGPLELGYKACLFSRTASRVFLLVKEIRCEDAEDLYQGVYKINWSDHLDAGSTFAVTFDAPKTQNMSIKNTHFGALKVKDAVVDQFRELKGIRPVVDIVHPDVRIHVYYDGSKARISIDLSGESLHRRGYRLDGAHAPLKENLAAALLLLAEWDKKDGFDLIDPMCGSGTLLIEAALIKKNIAPGLLRKVFGFTKWKGHDEQLWQKLLQEATSSIRRGRKQFPKIIGYDKDSVAVESALANVARAGLSGAVTITRQELKKAKPLSEKGIVITNPPYGERLGEMVELQALYRELGDIFKQRFKGWEGYIFTSSSTLAKSVGLKTTRKFVLYNGAIECRLLKYELY